MQTLIQQNYRLHEIMQKCQEQIIQLKKIGQDHEQEINNLLKCNERLLSIIQNEMPNNVLSRTSSGSNLHPIDQTNQKQHQTMNIPHRFITPTHSSGHLLKNRVEHLQAQQVERLSEQQESEEEEYKKHVNLPTTHANRDTKNHSDGFTVNRFRNGDSYEARQQRPQLSSGRNSTEHYPENVIYRQENQSLIEIPKFFKLDMGLNEHYQKQLFQSVQEFRPPLRNSNNSNQFNLHSQQFSTTNSIAPPNLPRFPSHQRKQSIPSVHSSQMHKISQAVTQRPLINQQELKEEFTTMRQLISQYKQDFDTQEYTHLCTIIRNDLENDMKELSGVNNESMKFYLQKERELAKLKKEISGFSPVQKLIEIMSRLKMSEQTERMIVNKVSPSYYKNAAGSGANANNGYKMNGGGRK